MVLLEINQLNIAFPNRWGAGHVVRDLTLSLNQGEILGLVGESGAGKSTVGNAVIDLLSPPGRRTSGDIILSSQKISDLTHEEIRTLRGKRIGFIFQDPMTSLNPLFRVETQIVETLIEHHAIRQNQAFDKALELLKAVGIPEPEVRVKQFPHQLSGGMRQRVVIAIALAGEPELIIADEPTTALDVSIQNQILELIRSLCKSRNVGCLFVTHDMGVIANVTDRVAVMYKGELVEIGDTHKVLNTPEHPYTQSLISAVPRSDIKLKRFPHVNYIEEDKHKAIDLSHHWLGQQIHPASESIGAQKQSLLKIDCVSLSFEKQPALLKKNRVFTKACNEISFQVFSGESYGLVGESGSGKSSIARVIAGLYQPDSGSVIFDNQELTGLTEQQRRPLRQSIQMIFQNPYSSLNARMRILDIIIEPMMFHQLVDSYDQAKSIVLDLLDYVGLEKQAAMRYPHEFSGGQKQRISIARALATRPRLLICDEPTSALDVSVQAQILNLLKDLQEALGLTLLFISHDLPVIRQMCDRVGVMKQGFLVEEAGTDSLFDHPAHPYTQKLIALMPKLGDLSKQGLDKLME